MYDRIGLIKKEHSKHFGSSPEAITRGPGRVDLMGSHTDYNDGFVLPVAVNVDVMAGGRLRDDNKIGVYSANFKKSVEFSLDNIEFDTVNTWSNYVRGVIHFLKEAGVKLRGADMVIHGNVPIGSGLSSSAAIEMATGYLMQTLNGFEMSAPDLALIGQKAENKFVGVNTGIMDQFISRLGKKDHALFLDCRTLEYGYVPLDTSQVKIVVCDTMKRRGLVDSEYDLRRSQCEEGARLFAQWYPNVKALRDVTSEMYDEHKADLPEVVSKRVAHVVGENERVLRSRDVLQAGDFVEFGRLMNASHDSARDLYEVSCAELEAMVEVTRAAPGSLAGRMAGAGFGGCTVSLVKDETVEQFLEVVRVEYHKKTQLMPSLYVCTAEDGTGVVERL
ncbi:MAG: galactokinase [Armatimonadetes bacterium]|jgi:galactokinase|nr:galactokinase [Armatimonadota bacterium]